MFLTKNDIHVWQIAEPSSSDKSYPLARYLSDTETQRALRFKFTKHGLWWAYVRDAMRDVLSKYTDTSPSEIGLLTSDKGKPYLDKNRHPQLYFNQSHTKNMACLAITNAGPIGIDIEEVKVMNDMNEIASRFFSTQEQSHFSQIKDLQTKTNTFFQIWTKKEAVLKANGQGMFIGLDTFDISPLSNNTWQQTTTRPPLSETGEYYVKTLDYPKPYMAALCLHISRIHTFRPPTIRKYTYEYFFRRPSA